MEIFEDDPLDQDALITSLGGTPSATSGPTPEQIAKLKAIIAASKPQTPRQVLDSITPAKPGVGPTRERAAQERARTFGDQGNWVERARTVKAEGERPSAMGGTAIPAEAATGALSSLWDSYRGSTGILDALRKTPQAVGNAATEGGRRAMTSVLQPEQTTMKDEAEARGHEPGFLGGIALNAVTDPTTPLGGEADDVTRVAASAGGGAVAGKAGAALAALMGGLKKVAPDAAQATEKVADEPVEAVLGKVLKTAKTPKTPKKPPFAFAPVDDAALARQAMFSADAPVKYAELPKTARPMAVYREIQGGGVSVQPLTGQRVNVGEPGPTMVGIFPNANKRTLAIPAAQFSQKDVRKFYETNRDVFAKDPEAFVGGWLDDKTNTVYLDVSKGFETTRAATKFGELQNPGGQIRAGKVVPPKAGEVMPVRDPITGKWPVAQEKVFEPESMKEPPVGNLHEFINSSEFQDRVHEMAEIGRKTMGGDNPEWWNIVNGPMARVYGKENVEALAGYIASTSPQNGPVANLKMASELMRRHLKNEPVRQPDWRAPATAMGKVDAEGNQVLVKSGKNKGEFAGEGFAPKAGAGFPNEGTYAPNAERVRAGEAATVADDKVNDMFHALMGKLVGVFDRHWAKIAEKPEAGIYADVVQNRLAGSMTSGQVEAYPLVENAVRTAAKNAGVDISKYSAWVWEGIRDTIRSTGKLYGQTHRANAVPETTTGFNEIFTQLLTQKAKHLGVTVPKLEEMLRNGDAELLTALLATPVGAAAYARWRAQQQPSQPGGGT